MTLQITCIRMNHDTWPETYLMFIYILIENIHFHIFEVVYNFFLTCNEVKSSKYSNMLSSINLYQLQHVRHSCLQIHFIFHLYFIGIGKISFIMKSNYNYINNNGS